MGKCDPLPPVSRDRQTSLLLSRRWSTPVQPTLDLYHHYINGTNHNDAILREHRKLLCKTADGKSRDKHRSTYGSEFSPEVTSAKILAWSRKKFQEWKRKRPRDSDVDDDRGSQGSALSRRLTASRMSTRSHEPLMRMRTQSTLSVSDTEEQKPVHIRTFWWYCGVIKAICKLGLDMQRLSMRKTEQTALSEMYYVNVSGAAPGEQEDNQILFFDKSLFTRKRAACRCPEWAQNLMIRKPEDRKPEEVQHLKQLLMSMRSFREKYTDEMRTKMCQVVRYTRCDKGRVVLRQGHKGHYFYFIYSGSVFIQIDVHDARTGETTPSTENVIRTGDSFGEIALLGDGVRSASVICREPTELCQIDKSTFLRICPALFQQQLEEKMQFASGFELFRHWPEEQVRQLCFLSQLLYIPHGRILELDWANTQYVYLIMRGRISMIKEFDVSGAETEEMTPSGLDPGRVRGQGEGQGAGRAVDRRVAGGSGQSGQEVDKVRPGVSTRFACVGSLRPGQATELRVLCMKPPALPSITLLSEGVRVLRVAARNFARFSPRRQAEEYLKKVYQPLKIPSTEALLERYRTDLHWRTFRKRVLGTVTGQRNGRQMSTIPATAKGSSGWARWPGFDPQAREKTALLSERGARSDTYDFPLVRLPDSMPRRRSKAKDKAKKGPDIYRSVTVTSEVSRVSSNDVSNDHTLVLYPPMKKGPAFLRKSLTQC